MKYRPFGVEIEFTTGSRARGTEGTRRILLDNGFSVAGYDRYGNYCSDGYQMHHDGSDVELKTPILQGEKGLSELKKVMNLLKSYGGHATNRDGMHVHFDAADFMNKHEKVVAMVETWYANQELLFSLVPEWRSRSNWCRRWDLRMMQNLKSGNVFDNGAGYPMSFGRNSLNIDALHSHGTFEIRLHHGTLDYNEASSWIRFCSRLIDRVSEYEAPLERETSVEELTKRVRVTKNASRYLTKKARNVSETAYSYQKFVRICLNWAFV